MFFCYVGLLMFVAIFFISAYVCSIQWRKAEDYQIQQVKYDNTIGNPCSLSQLSNVEEASRVWACVTLAISAVAALILLIGGAIMWANS